MASAWSGRMKELGRYPPLPVYLSSTIIPSLTCMRLWFTCARPFEEMCFFCEKGISSNGLAQVNHKRMHVREGMIVELRYTGRGGYRPNSFIRPNHAEAMLKTGYYRRVARLTNS